MTQPGWNGAERRGGWAFARSPASPGHTLRLAARLLAVRHLRFDAADPLWPDRDRLVLSGDTRILAEAMAPSAGGCGVAAGLAHDVAESKLSLGIALGLAHAERLLAGRHGGSLVDHRTWLFASELDLMGGAAQEAACAAGQLRLGRLTAIVAADAGATRLAAFAAKGWSVREVDAACPAAIGSAFSAATRSLRPSLIVCHGDRHDDASATMNAFADDDGTGDASPRHGAGARRGWLKRLARHSGRQDFERAQSGRLPLRWHELLAGPGAILLTGQADAATAATLRLALSRLAGTLPELVMLGAGDPTTEAAARNLWAMQPHAMAAALSGIALHGGLIALGQAPLSDVEQFLPMLRVAAGHALRITIAFTEARDESCAWGRRAALRAIPGLLVFRPADATETVECAELALRRQQGPSVLLLSGQARPLLADRTTRTRSARGGYLLRETVTPRQLTLLASGPEVALALDVASVLRDQGIAAAIASLPCWDLFAAQDQAWRDHVLGSVPVVGIETGSGFGWDRWIAASEHRRPGLFIDPGEADAPSLAARIRSNLDKAVRIIETPGQVGRFCAAAR